MLKTLTIKNILTHKDTTLEFSGGVNVLKGQSESGKSNSIEAFRWLKDNRPSVKSLISHFADDDDVSEVTTVFDNGTVTRRKTTKFNGYLINGVPLKAIDTDVPEEVTTLLNMNDVNLHSQFDGFFLLQKSAGDVARSFNNLVGLSVIDSSIKRVNALMTSSKAELTRCTDELQGFNEEIKTLAVYEKAQAKITILDNFINQFNDIDGSLSELKEADTELTEKNHEIKVLKDRVEATNTKILSLGVYIVEYQKLDEDLTYLNHLECSLREASKDLVPEKKMVSSETLLLETFELINREKVERSSKTFFEEALTRLTQCTHTINTQYDILQKNEIAFNKTLKQMGKCPLCGAKT